MALFSIAFKVLNNKLFYALPSIYRPFMENFYENRLVNLVSTALEFTFFIALIPYFLTINMHDLVFYVYSTLWQANKGSANQFRRSFGLIQG
jgi:hypothetical protein